MPVVSVIVPTRGRPVLVCEAVQSVLNQTLSDVEIIVVIDGPDRATEDALRDLNDSRIQVIPLAQSVGGSEARNTGARAAKADLIALLDDDDSWLPRKLERQLRYVKSEGLQILVTKYFLRSGDGPDVIWPKRFPYKDEPVSEYMFCTVGNLFQTSTIVCSRELLLKVPFTKGLARLQDWDWLLKALHEPGVELITVPEVLSIYNVGGKGGTISKSYDWERSLRWAQENRQYMTPRAYRGVIAKKCAPDAAQQKAGFASVWMLFKESLLGPEIRFREPIMFWIYYFLPPWRRNMLGNIAQRRSSQQSSIAPQE